MTETGGFTEIKETLIVDEDGGPIRITPEEKFQLISLELISRFIDPELIPEFRELIRNLVKEHGEAPFIIEGIKWHPTESEIITAKDSYGKKFEIKTMYAMVYYGT